ncbi:MAG TPA: crosslink repair DNA glycosylase YcaQ family protein [Pyrinomonadaceae bacterium]|nr:crosslink repair DNA glycosylase YcaQ family protein [Pyrinomonadaceae bacterium]
MIKTLPEEVEAYRDRMWRREPEARVETAADAEKLVEAVGFCATMTDARRPGPSLYVAVCGRRDAHMPRNVQKDPESSLTWVLKDELMRRGRVYYAKLGKNRSTFVAPRLVPHFNALWGVQRRDESKALSEDARAVLKVLRKEWEMATCDLRQASKMSTDRARFTRALDELQRALKVIPQEVLYEPWFTYIWALSEGRFARELASKVRREDALREVARTYLEGAGMTLLGELAKVTGLSRTEAGKGNHALVDEGYAERVERGVYRLADFDERARRMDVDEA